MDLPEVTEIQRWELRPGDRLIVRADWNLSNDDAARVKERVRAALALPPEFPILVVPGSMRVEVAAAPPSDIRSPS